MKPKTPRPSYTLSAGRYRLPLGRKTAIMGIINLTPDSFSADGCLKQDKGGADTAARLVKKMIRDGADIIDIGGESSRPGAQRVSIREETGRILPLLKRIARTCTVPISVDTYKPQVAKAALDAGASMINNIQGAQPDRTLLKMVRDYDAAVVLMHMRGTPRTMQKNTHYADLIREIRNYLQKSVEICLEIGIKSDRILIDPGIGFGKTLTQNLELLRGLSDFHVLHQPVLIGTSRKSFIGNILDQDVHHRVLGTAATVCAGILNGAHIIRVHDVKEMKQIATITDAILHPELTHV